MMASVLYHTAVFFMTGLHIQMTITCLDNSLYAQRFNLTGKHFFQSNYDLKFEMIYAYVKI